MSDKNTETRQCYFLGYLLSIVITLTGKSLGQSQLENYKHQAEAVHRIQMNGMQF